MTNGTVTAWVADIGQVSDQTAEKIREATSQAIREIHTARSTLEALATDFVRLSKEAPWFTMFRSEKYELHVVDKTLLEALPWTGRTRLVRELPLRKDGTHPFLVLFGTDHKPTKRAKIQANALLGAYIAGRGG